MTAQTRASSGVGSGVAGASDNGASWRVQYEEGDWLEFPDREAAEEWAALVSAAHADVFGAPPRLRVWSHTQTMTLERDLDFTAVSVVADSAPYKERWHRLRRLYEWAVSGRYKLERHGPRD